MKNILSYIPGYRTKKAWKMVIASIYYALSVVMLTARFDAFLFFAAAPFMIFGFIGFAHKKNINQLIIAIICLILMVVGLNIDTNTGKESESSPSPTITATATPTPTPEPAATPTPTPESTLMPTPVITEPPIVEEAPVVEKSSTVEDQSVNANTGNSAANSEATYSSNNSGNNTEMVWVGDSGTKYHHENCRTLKGNKHQITLQQALNEGREPCKVCH